MLNTLGVILLLALSSGAEVYKSLDGTVNLSSTTLYVGGTGGQVKFNDGTAQSSAGIGAGSDNNLSGNNSYTGASTFKASVSLLGTGSVTFGIGTSSLVFTSNSLLGIGTTSPCSTCAVQVAGNINATGSIRQGAILNCSLGLQTDGDGKISGCAASDSRLKTGVSTMPYDSAAIDALRPVNFTYTEASGRDREDHAGFIAQEVDTVLPRAVVPGGNEYLAVDPNAILAAVVKELQSLRARVQTLEAAP